MPKQSANNTPGTINDQLTDRSAVDRDHLPDYPMQLQTAIALLFSKTNQFVQLVVANIIKRYMIINLI